MSASQFVDYVKIYFRSGAGGKGIVSWRQEKFVDQGGPDGGDGGDGGSIVLEGNSQLWTLLDLKYRKHIHAEPGSKGMAKRMKGKSAEDVIVKVPLGTVVKDSKTGEIIGEISIHGEKLVLLEGGKGGLGNWHFRSSTNQTPEYSGPGYPGKEITAILELKVLADVGLVGFPNAGKSTLLSVITAAKPKIADYPFTTLVPNLGIVRYKDAGSFMMADIPGIMEGAHEGKGLGHTFLRHIERNSVLIFLIPADSDDPAREFEILLNELKEYNPHLLHKKRIVVISKSDLLEKNSKAKIRKIMPAGEQALFISSLSKDGLSDLLDSLWKILN